ncbi:MAG: leucine-rich repeat domain-containing protein [Bacteroidaceae bacterium]|nr:leucine-rich repeat domain-containing protein [Bacteroidaceae bacterium]
MKTILGLFINVVRYINLFLIVILLFGCNTKTNIEEFEIDGIFYKVISSSEKTVAITNYGGTSNMLYGGYSGSIFINQSINYDGTTYKIISIDESAFQNCTNLKNVNLPNSITNIGEWAFANCTNLVSIKLPEGIEEIGEMTFAHCSSLNKINIPSSVKTIGHSAFAGCTEITKIILPNKLETIDDWAFQDCKI